MGFVTLSNGYLSLQKLVMNSLCNPYLFSDQVDRDLTENSEKGRFDVATYEVVS